MEPGSQASSATPDNSGESEQQQGHHGHGGGDCALCGEPRSLDASLMDELNYQYERRLRFIEENGNDPHLKVELFNDWIRQLRNLNLEMVDVLREVQDTFKKHLNKMQTNYNANEERFASDVLKRLENDRDNLLEVIRRAYSHGSWDITGIKFYDVTMDDLFGKRTDSENVDSPALSLSLAISSNYPIGNPEIEQLRNELEARDREVEHLKSIVEKNKIQEVDVSRPEDNNESLGKQLRQLVLDKNQELEHRSLEIDKLGKEIIELKNSLDTVKKQESEQNSSLPNPTLNETATSNTNLLQELDSLKRVNSDLRKSIVDNQSLVNEIKDHHDRNRQLEKKLRKCEQSLSEADSAVRHRNKVIDQLRQDNAELKKAVPEGTNTRQVVPTANELESDSQISLEIGSLQSVESITSFDSVRSDSSSTETIVRSSGIILAEEDLGVKIQQLHTARGAQDAVIAELRNKLCSNEAEMNVLRNEYGNNERIMDLVRAEIFRLIKATQENYGQHIEMPGFVDSLDDPCSQPLIGVHMPDSMLGEKDQAILECLRQHLSVLARAAVMQRETSAGLEKAKREIEKLQQEKNAKERHIDMLQRAKIDKPKRSHSTQNIQSRFCPKTEDKETSIDSDMMSYSESLNDALASQQIRMQQVLKDMAKEISYLIGKDFSCESLSSLSELDVAPLHYLIGDLKKEISAKDSLLLSREESIVRLEALVAFHEKELHRSKLRHEATEKDRLSYEKRIENLHGALREHDHTIEALRQRCALTSQQLEDERETMKTYKKNLGRQLEEKSALQDECKNQLVTISNLRTALEETRRNGSASVSLPSLLRGLSAVSDSGSSNHFQPQHHNYHSNATNVASPTHHATNNSTNNNNNSNNNSNISNNSTANASSNGGGSSYWSAFWRA